MALFMHKDYVTTDHQCTINSQTEFPLQVHRRTMVIYFTHNYAATSNQRKKHQAASGGPAACPD